MHYVRDPQLKVGTNESFPISHKILHARAMQKEKKDWCNKPPEMDDGCLVL